MKINDLKRAIQTKAREMEIALESERPHAELLSIYKEIKELQYQLLQLELQQPAAIFS